ncbi:hypothetical protein PG995_014628 [Apiospora arundinis]
MAPNSRWTPEKTEALLNALGKTLLKTATLAQKESIEGHMKDAGYDATWEAVSPNLSSEAAIMSNYKPKRNTRTYMHWDASKHEDILIAMVTYFDPTKAQYDAIHDIVKDMGHSFTSSAMSTPPGCSA